MTLKVNNIPDWTQAELDAQISLGNFPPGTLLADIVLPSDWNQIQAELDTKIGATTNQTITQIAGAAFTYTDGKLTNITYSNGTEKELAYNMDGTLNTLTITYPDETPIVKTLSWDAGVLEGISVA